MRRASPSSDDAAPVRTNKPPPGDGKPPRVAWRLWRDEHLAGMRGRRDVAWALLSGLLGLPYRLALAFTGLLQSETVWQRVAADPWLWLTAALVFGINLQYAISRRYTRREEHDPSLSRPRPHRGARRMIGSPRQRATQHFVDAARLLAQGPWPRLGGRLQGKVVAERPARATGDDRIGLQYVELHDLDVNDSGRRRARSGSS